MSNDITHHVETGLTAWAGHDASKTMTHLTGTTVRRLMRRHGKTIKGLAGSMGLTQARVREVRANGVIGAAYVMDWMEGVAGNPHAGWDEVARAYLAQRGIWRPSSTRGETGNAFPQAELGRVGPR
jgi:hypothetical protein